MTKGEGRGMTLREGQTLTLITDNEETKVKITRIRGAINNLKVDVHVLAPKNTKIIPPSTKV